jgi:hypothetical protein
MNTVKITPKLTKGKEINMISSETLKKRSSKNIDGINVISPNSQNAMYASPDFGRPNTSSKKQIF